MSNISLLLWMATDDERKNACDHETSGHAEGAKRIFEIALDCSKEKSK